MQHLIVKDQIQTLTGSPEQAKKVLNELIEKYNSLVKAFDELKDRVDHLQDARSDD